MKKTKSILILAALLALSAPAWAGVPSLASPFFCADGRGVGGAVNGAADRAASIADR